MAYREIVVVEIHEILRRWLMGDGYRRIADELSVDRKTVRRYVEAAQELGLSRDEPGGLSDELVGGVAHDVRPGAPSTPGEMREHCRTHRERIKGWLGDDIPATKIQKLLVRHTQKLVPLRTLQRFIADELGLGRGQKTTVRVADCEPGAELQVDFTDLGMIGDASGRRRKLQALVCTSVYSRHMFVWPCFDQKIPTVIDGLEAAWAFFGGVFRVVIPDNLKSVVTQADPHAPTLCEAFLEYSQARGFLVDAARVRRPQDKPRVERSVHYVQQNFFAGEQFRSLDEAREAALRWCRDEAGTRIHGTTHAKPLEVFERDEKQALLPAPTEPYDQPRWLDVKVGRDHVVTADYALYSVPQGLAGKAARVRLDRSTARIYVEGELVRAHARQPRGGRSILPEDLPEQSRDTALRDEAALIEKAQSHGAAIGEYARRLLQHPLPWTKVRQVHRLLSLVARHGAAAVELACEQALKLDVVEVTRIQRMLERALEQGQPSSPPDPPVSAPPRWARANEAYARPTGERSGTVGGAAC